MTPGNFNRNTIQLEDTFHPMVEFLTTPPEIHALTQNLDATVHINLPRKSVYNIMKSISWIFLSLCGINIQPKSEKRQSLISPRFPRVNRPWLVLINFGEIFIP
jgi:hypothetical protein